MNSRIEHPQSHSRNSRRAFQVFAICDDDPGRLEGPCRNLPNGRRATLLLFDCASAIEAAFKGVIDVLIVNWSRSSPERLTALSLLHREKPQIQIYFVIDEAGSALHLEPWEYAY